MASIVGKGWPRDDRGHGRHDGATKGWEMRSIVSICFALLVVVGLAAAQDSDTGKVCSNKTLNGDYGFIVTGFRMTPAGTFAPMGGTALTHFDGNGNLTQTDNINTGAGPLPADRFAQGTYQLNADCSGRMTIQPANQPAIELRIVVVDEGREVRTGVVTSGIIVTSDGRKK